MSGCSVLWAVRGLLSPVPARSVWAVRAGVREEIRLSAREPCAVAGGRTPTLVAAEVLRGPRSVASSAGLRVCEEATDRGR